MFKKSAAYWPKANSFFRYLSEGWIRPDKLPSSNYFEFSKQWCDFFNRLTATEKNKIPKYSELDEATQIEFLEYRVVVRDMGNMPVDEIREVFKRINSTSYGLNAMELHNSRFN